MSTHITVSPGEAADRLAIRELVEAYARYADRRDATGQMSLFTMDTHFVVYMNAKDPTPSQELRSRAALAPVFAELNRYEATTHFVGQTTVLTLTPDRATGETYCLAPHVTIDGGQRRLMVASLRYLDEFVKIDDAWLFSERLWLSQSRSEPDSGSVQLSAWPVAPSGGSTPTAKSGSVHGRAAQEERNRLGVRSAACPDEIRVDVSRWLCRRAIVPVVEPADLSRHSRRIEPMTRST